MDYGSQGRASEVVNLALPDGAHAVRLMLVCAPGLTSWLISREGLPWGGFSHAMNLLRDGTVIDARSDRQPCVKDGIKRAGVQHRPHDYTTWKRAIVIEWRVHQAVESSWENWLRRQIDDGYDRGAIVGFVLGIRAHARKHWICSALCTGALKHVGVFHDGHASIIDDSDISPSTLAAVSLLGAGGVITFRQGKS